MSVPVQWKSSLSKEKPEMRARIATCGFPTWLPLGAARPAAAE